MDTSHADPAPAAGATTTTLTDTGTQLRDMQAAYTALQDFQNDALKSTLKLFDLRFSRSLTSTRPP